MTAWQVFAMNHWLGHRVLRQHGCFSINREGHDVRAFRQAVRILEGARPLVIFPEGEVFHLNDRVMHFRRGAATAALRAARRSGRPVACVPTAIKYHYVENLEPALLELMSRLERRVGLSPRTEMPLARRILRVADSALGTKELEHFGSTQSGSKEERRRNLVAALLGRLEDRYRVRERPATIPERVKELRRRAIAVIESAPGSQQREQVQCEQAQRDLDDLFSAMQLFSYPADYLASNPSPERLAETLDKLEEDLLQAPTAQRRGVRRAIVAFGEPVLAQPYGDRKRAGSALTETMELRVQQLLDSVAHRPQKVAESSSAAPVIPLPAAESWNALPVTA
jgi:hypothetical protein